MKISAINNFSNYSNTKRNNKQIAFGFYSYVEDGHRTIDTHYLRDYPSLQKFADETKRSFQDGAVTLKYACSTGEGATSLAAIFNDERFNIIGLDISGEAQRARTKSHYISNDLTLDEKYLLDTCDDIPENIRGRILKIREFFRNHFAYKQSDRSLYPGVSAAYEINQNRAIPNLIYPDRRFGDILLLDRLDVGSLAQNFQPVSGISFRNAIFQLGTENHGLGKNVVQVIQDYLYGFLKDRLSEQEVVERNVPTVKEYDDMIGRYKGIVQSMNRRLAPNGLVMIGNSPNDHYFIAPNGIHRGETMKFSVTEYCRRMGYNGTNVLLDNIRVFVESPLKRLFLDNGFVELFDSKIIYDGKPVTTIFRKAKNII